jgi:hypothetical protein
MYCVHFWSFGAFLVIWCILGHVVHFLRFWCIFTVLAHFVWFLLHFLRFWYIAPSKIWQPRLQPTCCRRDDLVVTANKKRVWRHSPHFCLGQKQHENARRGRGPRAGSTKQLQAGKIDSGTGDSLWPNNATNYFFLEIF